MKSILVLLVLPILLLLIGCNSSPTNNIEPKGSDLVGQWSLKKTVVIAKNIKYDYSPEEYILIITSGNTYNAFHNGKLDTKYDFKVVKKNNYASEIIEFSKNTTMPYVIDKIIDKITPDSLVLLDDCTDPVEYIYTRQK